MKDGNTDKAGFTRRTYNLYQQNEFSWLQAGTFYRLNLSGFLIPLKINKLNTERY